MKTYNFDEIAQSQDFNHDDKFVLAKDIIEEIQARIDFISHTDEGKPRSILGSVDQAVVDHMKWIIRFIEG